MLKIYFGTKPLILSTQITQEIDPYLQKQTTVFTAQVDDKALTALVEALQQPDKQAGILLYKNEQEALELLKKRFTVIEAAGGLVYTEQESVLLIFRRGKWDLPKGKLDKGEELEACAIREVEEETGLEQIQLKEKLTVTYHTYFDKQQHFLKQSHWWLMKVAQKQTVTPQTEEDIEECRWVELKNSAPYLENAHPSIIDVVDKGVAYLKYNEKV